MKELLIDHVDIIYFVEGKLIICEQRFKKLTSTNKNENLEQLSKKANVRNDLQTTKKVQKKKPKGVKAFSLIQRLIKFSFIFSGRNE